jgi:hypothetical protein
MLSKGVTMRPYQLRTRGPVIAGKDCNRRAASLSARRAGIASAAGGDRSIPRTGRRIGRGSDLSSIERPYDGGCHRKAEWLS